MADHLRVETTGFDHLIRRVKKMESQTISRTLDKVTTMISATARREISAIEEKGLRLGGVNQKTKNGISHTGGTVMDEKTGTYRAISMKHKASDGGGLRMDNFSFEHSAYSRRMARVSSYSRLNVTSQLQNLWSKETKPYRSRSPYFRRGTKGKWSFVPAGETREARLSWPAFVSTVRKNMDIGVNRADTWLQAEIDKDEDK